MGQAKWKTFTEEELQQFIKDSVSYASFAEKMGYAANGGSGAKAAKTAIEHYNFDISHFEHQAHNKGNFDYSRFRYGNNIKIAQAVDALVALRGHKCESCGLSEWLEKPISLEVHHKDGDHLNNTLENLEILCPNCHSFTKNWRGKNISKVDKEMVSEQTFVNALESSTSVRQALIKLGLTAAGGNYTRAYDLINRYQIKHLIK